MKCHICEIKCEIKTGRTGRCGMYRNTGSRIEEVYPGRYLGAVETAIESMPMVHYHPRGIFLQVCTVGCNFTCPGCVSETLTDHMDAIEGQFQEMTPGQVVAKAKALNCIGVIFCFNEPTVSYFTFKALAGMAREHGLLVGCSTNGYMTEWALQGLIPFLDFVNVGLKGVTPEACRPCGITDTAPILRNIRILYEKGVYFEVSAIFRKSGEDEIEKTAKFISSLSRQIPFQVMRFIPFGRVSADLEPSVREAEAVCKDLRRHLDYVYLFNTAGTRDLNTFCPDCGAKIMERGFFGPMCSNLNWHRDQGRCACGYVLPIRGKIHNTRPVETGYFGGYRTISALGMIRSILAVLGVRDKTCMDEVMVHVIKADMIKDLYGRLNNMDAYFDTVDEFAALAGLQDRAKAFRSYVGARVDLIREKTGGIQGPWVYCALGHPLIAVFEEKMESLLVEAAGGRLAVRRVQRETRPGIPIRADQFCRMAPDIIILTSGAAWPPGDFMGFCRDKGLDAPAVRDNRIFDLSPFRCSTNPDWILGLMALANIIHPDIFDFNLEQEADDFYQRFYGLPFNNGTPPAFPWQKKAFRSAAGNGAGIK